MDILLDTGFLVALIARDSVHHSTAKFVLQEYSHANLHTLWECITEAGHFLNSQGRSALLYWLDDYGVTVHHSRIEDLKKMAVYIKKYSNVSKGKGADIADVSLVFLAEYLKTTWIFTVDRGDFDSYRTVTGKHFKRLWLEN